MLSKTSLAVFAGMAVTASLLVAPAVVAGPMPGRAVAWGFNNDGQLGDNSLTKSLVPVVVDMSGALAGKAVTAIDAGVAHMCAVADGKAYCWGSNFIGRLGNNSLTDSAVPVAVDTTGPLAGKTVTAISAGYLHTCAVADGRAYCWGDGEYGQLGDGTPPGYSLVPVAVNTTGVFAPGVLAGKTVTVITAGYLHTCAVADGRAYCWGGGEHGRLGNNSLTDSYVPVAVSTAGPLAGKTVTAISAGFSHTCAVADGKAYCWGWNTYGQLGNNSITDSPVPVAVSTVGPLAGKTVTAIDAGSWHTCAVADGKAYCWGDNFSGQFGDTTTTGSAVPVAVDTSGVLAHKTVTAIAAGGNHTCAVADGKAYCWGFNSGSLGNNSLTNSPVPVAVSTAGPLAGKTVTAITAGAELSAAVLGAAVPQPPTAVAGKPGKAKVTVSWAAPGDDGGLPVMEYVATATPGGRPAPPVHLVRGGRADQRHRLQVHGDRPQRHRHVATLGAVRDGQAHHLHPGQGDWFRRRGQEAEGEDHLEGGSGRHLLPGADLQTRRQEVQGLEDHQQTGVQSESPQGQEVPRPSGRDRSRRTRTGHHHPVQRQVDLHRAGAVGEAHSRSPLSGRVHLLRHQFAGISCRTAHPCPPRDAHRHAVNIPKMPGEPLRVQPSRKARSERGDVGIRGDAQRKLAGTSTVGGFVRALAGELTPVGVVEA